MGVSVVHQGPASPSHSLVVARLRRRLAERDRVEIDLAGLRPAAVAIVLGERRGVTHVTLTVRSPHLRAHSGQISLPGGSCDRCDPSAVATALRECREEVGLAPELLHVLGILDDEPTTSGFIITPVVAELKARPRYRPNPDEVAAVFEAPLTVFADRARGRERGTFTMNGAVYTRRMYRYREHLITGATARILERLNDLAR